MKYHKIDSSLFINNRKKFIDMMKPNSVAFFNSNDIYPISADSTLPFEQHRDIFYLSGVDIIENDKLGRLSVSIKGCMERDKFIISLCKEYEIPVQVSMGGGYSTKLNEIIEAHANTFRLAQNIFF